MTPAVLAMVVATLLIPTGPADAQNYPWCAQGGDGGTNCGFVSYEQCRRQVAGATKIPCTSRRPGHRSRVAARAELAGNLS
jgi:hypothetical protein